MTQQIIVDIKKSYPFGQIGLSYLKNKITVRKIIYFDNQFHYNSIKQKIHIFKSLKSSTLIKIINILEGQGQLHLIYQYIPVKYQTTKSYFKSQNHLLIKQKLIQMCMNFSEHNLITNIDIKNMGLDQNYQIKYYLDVQFYRTSTIIQYSLKNSYIIQINKLLNNLVQDTYDNPQETYYTENTPQINKKNIKSQKQLIINKTKKVSTFSDQQKPQIQRNKISSLQALNKIQQRINQLKANSKINTEKIRQKFNSKQNLRQTVNQKWKAQKVDTRKLSGHTIYQSYFNKNKVIQHQKTAVKNQIFKQQELNQTKLNEQKTKKKNTEYKYSKQQLLQKPKMVKKQNLKVKKQPSSKKDFEQIKKHEFKNFFKSKQKYVHQFLGLLGDVSQQQSKQTLLSRNKKQKNDQIKDEQYSHNEKNDQKLKSKKKQNELMKKKSKQIIVSESHDNFIRSINEKMFSSATSIIDKKNLKKQQEKSNKFGWDSIKINNKDDNSKLNEIKKINQQNKILSNGSSPKNGYKQKILKVIKDTDAAKEKSRKYSMMSEIKK